MILVRKEYLAKINNLPNHHGAGSLKARGPQRRGAPRGAVPPEARRPMQLHRLHWLKAGPGQCHVVSEMVGERERHILSQETRAPHSIDQTHYPAL